MDKCKFFKREAKFVGSLISEVGYKEDVQKQFCTPRKSVGEKHSLLGFLGYYRSCVKNISVSLKPLHELLEKDITKQNLKKVKTLKKKQTCELDSKTNITWTDQHQLILNKILDILKSPEQVALSDFEKPFKVYFDASETGWLAVLCRN